MSDKFKKRVRAVQSATGLSYTACLRTMRGDHPFKPTSERCEFMKALRDIGFTLPAVPVAIRATYVCQCLECDP